MNKQFISEPIKPDTSTFATSRMAAGEPGLPMRFVWRGRVIQITEVLETWKKTGPCRHGSGERYVRRHLYKVRTDSGSTLTIYFDRQYRLPSQRKIRWCCFPRKPRKSGNALPNSPDLFYHLKES